MIFHGMTCVKKFQAFCVGTYVHAQQTNPADLPGDSLEFLDIFHPKTHDSI